MTGWPAGGGEMAGRIRAHDWAATPLGPIDGWGPGLRTLVDLLLGSRPPMVLLWGPELIQVYNDAYRHILGDRHPRGLGQPTFACWPETLEIAGPIVERARAGEAVTLEDARFPIARSGAIEAAWFTVAFSPVLAEEAPGSVLVTPFDTTARVLADAARDEALASLRAGEERQAFLLKLSDALRPLSDPVAIQGAAMAVLGEKLGVNRAFYGDAQDDGDTLVIGPGYSRDTFPLDGRVRFSEFELDMAAWYRAGRTYVIHDARRDARLGAATRAGFAAIRVGAAVGVPLVKDGRVRAIVSLHQSEPRSWTAAEVALLEDTAERTWAAVERARAETTLRRSEESYRSLFEAAEHRAAELGAVLQSIGDAVYIGDLDGITVANQAALDQLGFANREQLNRHIGTLADEIGTRDPETNAPIPIDEQPFARALSGRATVREIRVRHRRSGEDRIIRSSASPVSMDGRVIAAVAVNTDVTDEKRAETALRASQERQAFLLRLSDALRPLGDPVAVQGVAARMLGVELRVDRCYYAEFDWPRDVLRIAQEYVGSASFSVVGEHPISAFQDLLAHSHKGEPLVCDDIAAHPVFSGEVAAYRERGTDGFILIPLVKQGVMAACMCVTMAVPRAWSAAEVEMVREVGDRTWEAAQRIRAEGATRESEERFRQFAASSSDALWIRDAATLAMEYVSPAIAEIYGIPPAAMLGDPRHWAALVVPEDRNAALEHIERARRGEAVTHEFRILRPSDQAFRWIRNTDFPLLDGEGRVQRVGGIAEDVTDSKLAAEHGRVLLLELQHRVRNIIAVIRSVASQTGDTVDGAEDYRDRLVGRLSAIARVQTLLTREANAGVDLATLVEAELSAQAGRAEQYAAAGTRLQLAPKAAEVLTLAIHELATNALKHGAFSHPGGRLAVRWASFYERGQPWLRLDWVESGAPAPLSPPRREGFGTALVRERVPYELKGRGRLTVEPGGLECRLEFPLRAGDSILQTDTVVLSTAIAGGALDMAGEADLDGCTVLVVEDDYYLATDAARALRKAGGAVAGPVGTEADALALIAGGAPRCALVDVNLGEGARFAVAEALQDRGVPFAFVTGYDDAAIPARFDAVERLRKPVDVRQVVRAAAQMCAA